MPYHPALTLAIDGYADFVDVDRSWMLTHSPECGPFGIMDRIGRDVVMKDLEEHRQVMEQIIGDSAIDAEMVEIINYFLGEYIDRGDLGVKTGKGFYTYPDPVYQTPDFFNASLCLNGQIQVSGQEYKGGSK